MNVMQPGEARAGQRSRAPRPATFVRACTHAQPPDQAADKAELESPGAGPEIDKYVAVEPP